MNNGIQSILVASDFSIDAAHAVNRAALLAGESFLGGVTRHTVSRAKCDVAVVPDWPRL